MKPKLLLILIVGLVLFLALSQSADASTYMYNRSHYVYGSSDYTLNYYTLNVTLKNTTGISANDTIYLVQRYSQIGMTYNLRQ
jgi:hypothetical protein